MTSEEKIVGAVESPTPQGQGRSLSHGMDTRVIVGEAARALEVPSNRGKGHDLAWRLSVSIIPVNLVRIHDIEFATTGIDVVEIGTVSSTEASQNLPTTKTVVTGGKSKFHADANGSNSRFGVRRRNMNRVDVRQSLFPKVGNHRHENQSATPAW
jgi:hypothetical protein